MDLSTHKRVVVKIGSALLVDDEGLRKAWLASVAADIAALRAAETDVIVVSSGAIALGCVRLGLHERPQRLDEAQGAACVGQIALMQAFETAFSEHGIVPGQMLLTLSDLDGRRTYLNARAALETLLAKGIVPVINENDAVATEEIRVGDNDRLAARVAQMTGADVLVLLSDIDGLYEADPRSTPDAKHIAHIEAISPDIIAMAAPLDPSSMSRGGMATKLEAGRLVTGSGCAMVIVDGQEPAPLSRLKAGARHSMFAASDIDQKDARKRWLSGQLGPQGAIIVDDGAASALAAGKSLLAAGILTANGPFMRGDVVRIQNGPAGNIAIGLSNYDSAEIARIAGLKSEDIAGKLGYTRSQTVVHRDNLVLDAKG
ncbi:MAG: glutamate 5-kinase [Pseudomonadota bacterium]